MSIRQKRPRIVLAFLIMFLAVILVVAGLGAYQFMKIQAIIKLSKAGAFAPPPTAVTTMIAEKTFWQPSLDTVGTVAAINGVTVSTDLAGVVTKIAFHSGTKVKAGDLLVQLNVDQENAQLAQAESQRDLTRLNLDRYKGLLAKRAISQSDFDSTDAAYHQASATVQQYQALIARKTLRAPFDGVTGIRQVNLGQFLNVGDPVVTLQSFDPIYVNFNLPQRNLSQIAVGYQVQVRVDAFGDEAFEGKITAINPMVDQTTRNVQIQATLPNPETKLRSGMYGRVSVIMPKSEAVIAIPSSSVHYAPYGDSVFIVSTLKGDDGKAAKVVKERFVKLGQTRGDMISIASGVEPGNEVVTSGVFRLRNNAPIIVNNQVQPGKELAPTPANS
ncbi:MAG: efflux RND transporter periplasmic adaptor subunit [Verrucomicrobia bacterium]|nr:efflux RND transporter periplasmic adaptor subunit [Verrucomicrobiota bacterium]